MVAGGKNHLNLKNQKKFVLTLLLVVIIGNTGVFILNVRDSVAKKPSNISGGGIGATGYYYSDWNQNITVGMDGSLLIVEEMVYTLDPGSYGFAFRNLNWRSFHDVTSWSIQSGPGTPQIYYYNIERTSDTIEFYWEFYRQSYSSQVDLTFILTYNVSSAMDLRGNRDRVYWNVIGEEFEVPIHDIDTRVIFPKEYELNAIQSTTYYQGDTPGDDKGTAINIDGKTHVVFHQGSVNAYESYTIDTDSPPAGIVMPFSWRVYLNSNWIICIGLGFVPFALFFLLAFIFKGIDPKVKTIPTLNEISTRKCVECGYRDVRKIKFCPLCGADVQTVSELGPPNNLSPAEVGTLLDEKFDKIDFVAEFFYMAEKGYLKIIQTDDSDEMYFQRTEKDAYYGELTKFDKSILKFIEDHSYDTLWFKERTEGESEKVEEIPVEVISLSVIKTNAADLWKNKNDIYNKLSGGDTPYFTQNPEKIRGRYSGTAIVLGIVGCTLLYILGEFFYIGNLIFGIIGVVAACLLGLILSNRMPKLTKYGAQMKGSWQSYLQLIRGQMLGFPDPYEQFTYSMDHFSYLLIDPNFDLPHHLKNIAKNISTRPPPAGYYYTAPYWYYYPRIYYPIHGGMTHRTITGFDSIGRGFESMVQGISNLAESLPNAISNMAEGLTSAISNMSEGFTPPSSSGGRSGFGGGFGGGGGGGGGGGIG